jgi:hypothetical protein
LAVSLVGGFLLDTASGHDFGLRMAFYTAMVLAVMTIRQMGVDADSWPALIGLTFLGTLAFNLTVLATLPANAVAASIGHVAGSVALECLLNMFILTLVNLLVILGSSFRQPRHRIKKEAYL